MVNPLMNHPVYEIESSYLGTLVALVTSLFSVRPWTCISTTNWVLLLPVPSENLPQNCILVASLDFRLRFFSSFFLVTCGLSRLIYAVLGDLLRKHGYSIRLYLFILFIYSRFTIRFFFFFFEEFCEWFRTRLLTKKKFTNVFSKVKKRFFFSSYLL